MSALSSISGSVVPSAGPALEPAAVRNGPPAAKRAYQTGLAFEQVLVDQLTQELASTATGGSSEGDPASNAYANLMPQTLGSAIMSAGGTGLAMQLATALDPALRGKS
jgi:hypothetical protein